MKKNLDLYPLRSCSLHFIGMRKTNPQLFENLKTFIRKSSLKVLRDRFDWLDLN